MDRTALHVARARQAHATLEPVGAVPYGRYDIPPDMASCMADACPSASACRAVVQSLVDDARA